MTQEKSFFSFKFEEPAPKKRRRPKRLRAARSPDLTIDQILQWADARHARTGEWPVVDSGAIKENPNEKWVGIDRALRRGTRSLPGGSSLPRLLAEHRGCPNHMQLTPLTIEQILNWADAHHSRTGKWPHVHAGPVHENSNENWQSLNRVLRLGLRGVPSIGGLAQLLIERRGAHFKHCSPRLTFALILEWADAHHARTGQWPNVESGPVHENGKERWRAIDGALRSGLRGLPRGRGLARLLIEKRGASFRNCSPPLTESIILQWADAHKRCTGAWPNEASPGIWPAIDLALRKGLRSLPGGSSLAQLLAQERGKRNHLDLPSLTAPQILEWADEHHRRTGSWPTAHSGPVEDAPGESWGAIDGSLAVGRRGQPGGTTLANLLAEHRGHRNILNLPRLTLRQILEWADAHFRRTGRWPAAGSGPVADAPGEHWGTIDNALRLGRRGLRGGMSVARLLDRRGRRRRARRKKR